MSERFDVFLTGERLPGFSHDDVVSRLMALTGRDRDGAAALLGAGEQRLKADTSLDETETTMAELRAAGAAAVFRPHGAAVPLVSPTVVTTSGAGRPRLYNANAASCWSLFLSPSFGAYLHMLNWRTLGFPEKAAVSKRWMVANLVLLAAYIVFQIVMLDPRTGSTVANEIGFAILMTWYFVSGREQARYVKDVLQNDYVRRPLWRPVLVGIGLFVAFVIVSGLLITITHPVDAT